MDAWLRGTTVGGCLSFGLATLFPGLLGVQEWPRWTTIPLGVVCVLFAVHWTIREVVMSRLSRRPEGRHLPGGSKKPSEL